MTTFLHTALFAAIAPLIFFFNQRSLLQGLDGRLVRYVMESQAVWMPMGLGLTQDPHQGMSNVFFPVNTLICVAFQFGSLFDGTWVDIATYTVFAVEFFVAVLLAGVIAGIGERNRLIAAWAMTAIALPMDTTHQLYAIYNLAPQIIEQMLLALLALYCFGRLRQAQGWPALGFTAVMITAIPLLICQSPLTSMVFVPVVAVMAVALLGKDRPTLLRQAGAVAAMLAVSAPAIAYNLFGVMSTVPTFFSSELLQVQDNLHNASIFYQGLLGGNPIGPRLIGIAALAALGRVFLMQGPARRSAAAMLAAMTLVVAGGYGLVTWATAYRGPQMVYFELPLWPFYAVFAAALVPTSGLLHLMERVYPGPRLRLLLPGLAAMLLVANAWARPSNSAAFQTRLEDFTTLLADEIALRPGQPFRGLEATINWAEEGVPLDWFVLHPKDHQLNHALGNDLRFVGLWLHGIPTLQEYSHYTTPQSYLLFSRLLARDYDRQIRSITVLSRVDQPYLASLGVRFVLTSAMLPPPAQERLSRAVPELGTLHLYELAAPNLGTYSPVEVLPAADAEAVVTTLRNGIDFQHTVLLAQTPQTPLVPAAFARLVPVRGAMTIEAESSGRSMLLLPVQYSRCLKVETVAGAEPILHRANLAQTGFEFTGKVTAKLHLDMGPLRNPYCRWEDYSDMKRLNIRGAASVWPIQRSAPTR